MSNQYYPAAGEKEKIMSIKDDVLQIEYPKYLTCPYCPSQSFPSKVRSIGWDNTRLRMYQCSAKHQFYIEEE